MSVPSLILASSSPYRRRQLDNLGVRVSQIAPDVDETPQPGETPQDRATRLSLDKARSVFAQAPSGHFVIAGSDQVCHMGSRIYRKPGTMQRAEQHLQAFSNQWVDFTTGLTLLDSEGRTESAHETFRVRFRQLTPQQITRYLELDQPLDCAGAIKVERLGITLLSDMQGRDMNSLVGLPLMLLNELLSRYDLSIIDFI